MSGDRFVIDTNIIIGILAGNMPSIKISRIDPLVVVSVITEIELLSFTRLTRTEESEIRLFLSACHVVYINPEIKDHAITLRKKSSLRTPDAIIAATAQYQKAQLVTDDEVLLKCRLVPTLSASEFFNKIQ